MADARVESVATSVCCCWYGRCVPGSRVRVRDRAGGSVRGGVGHPRADGRRPGRSLPVQARALPHAHPDDGLVPARGRGYATHPSRVRMARRRHAVPQPRGVLSAGQLHVPLHAELRVHGPQRDSGASQLQPGLQQHRRLPRAATLRR